MVVVVVGLGVGPVVLLVELWPGVVKVELVVGRRVVVEDEVEFTEVDGRMVVVDE